MNPQALRCASRLTGGTSLIYTAASSDRTLKIMFIIACIGIPLVLTYTATIYWTFRRCVEIGPHSY
jgi:cytochrome bd ubiquinol oxidase subunit II